MLWQVLSRGGEAGGARDTARGRVCLPVQTARGLSTLCYGGRVGVPVGGLSSHPPPPSSSAVSTAQKEACCSGGSSGAVRTDRVCMTHMLAGAMPL